jgi:hypothetical protein
MQNLSKENKMPKCANKRNWKRRGNQSITETMIRVNKDFRNQNKSIMEHTSFRTTIVGLDSFSPLLIPSLHLMESCPVPLSFHVSLTAGSLD